MITSATGIFADGLSLNKAVLSTYLRAQNMGGEGQGDYEMEVEEKKKVCSLAIFRL